MDSDGLSDPYVIIKLGDQVINDSRNYHQNETNCEVYKMFEMKAKLPGVSQLHVQFWDKDNYVSDDLIGETIIDLENRFFSKIWRNLPYAPIETRNLYIPTSQVSRGRVQLFLEMSPSKKPSTSQDIWQISPKPS
jgi:Ca2+-dependent lipid-binding protein